MNKETNEDCTGHLNESEEIRKKFPTKKRTPRKITGEWPESKVHKLIGIVEQRPELWNISLPNYKVAKDQIWQEVAAELNEEDWNSCRIKWQSLRVTFKVNLAKTVKSKSGQGANDSVKIFWKFFDAMKFIGTSDNTNSTASTSNFICDDENISVASEDVEHVLLPNNIIPGQRRKRCTTVNSTEVHTSAAATKSLKDIAEQALSLMKCEDHHSAFGNFIAEELRHCSDEDAQTLKRRLNRTLLDFWDEQSNKRLKQIECLEILEESEHSNEIPKITKNILDKK